MFRIILCVFLSYFILHSVTFGTSIRKLTDAELQEIQALPDVCGITGETYKQGYNTMNQIPFFLNIPIVYDGACKDTPNLEGQIERNIEEKLLEFFEKNNLIEYVATGGDEIKTFERDGRNVTVKVLGSAPQSLHFSDAGKEFIIKILFPQIQTSIQKELNQQNPNLRKVTALNYIAKTVGYQFAVEFQYISTKK